MARPAVARGVAAISVGAFVSYSMLVCVWYAVSAALSHDEHQFLASAFMAAHGLLPYRDFAYFHMPALVFLYEPLFLTAQPFLAARLFVGLCAGVVCLAVFRTALVLFPDGSRAARIATAIAAVILLMQAPLFRYGTGAVWNHAPATAFAVLAFLFHCRGLEKRSSAAWSFWSGMFLGLAIGIRLSIAPLAAPFLFVIFGLGAGSRREKTRRALAFAAGGILSNLGTLWLLARYSADFLFGNLTYPALQTLYYRRETAAPVITLAAKARDLFAAEFSRSGDLFLVLVAGYGLGLLALDRFRHRARPRSELLFLVMLAPFLLAGIWAPSPPQYQYYFVALPFLILFALYAFADLRVPALASAGRLLLGVIALVSVIGGALPLGPATARALLSPRAWPAVRVQVEAEQIHSMVGSQSNRGPVLTLSPAYAVSAGLPIYKEFVTVPFAWRVSGLVDPSVAAARHLPTLAGVGELIRSTRPRAILTGREEAVLEAPLNRAAEQAGYRRFVTPAGIVVWLPAAS